MSRKSHVLPLLGVLMNAVLAYAVTMAEADRLFEKRRWHAAAKAYDALATRKAGGRDCWQACLRAALAREQGGDRKGALAGANRVIRDVLGHGNDDLVGEAFLLKQRLLFHAKSQSGARNTLLNAAVARAGWTAEVSRLHENEAVQRLKEGEAEAAWRLLANGRVVLSSVGSNVVAVLSFARARASVRRAKDLERVVGVLSSLSAADRRLAAALSDFVCQSAAGEDRLRLTCAAAELSAAYGERKHACALYERLLAGCKDTALRQRVRLRYADHLKSSGMTDRCGDIYGDWCKDLKPGDRYAAGMKGYRGFLIVNHRYRTANEVFGRFCGEGTGVYTARERQAIAKRIESGLAARLDDAAAGWRMLAKAEALEHKGKFGDALKKYRTIAARHEGDLRNTALFRSGACHCAMGKYKAAANVWEGLCAGKDAELAVRCQKRMGDMLLMDVRDVAAARRAYGKAIAILDGDGGTPRRNERRDLEIAVAMCDLAAGDADAAVPVFRQEYERAVGRMDVDVAKWYALVAAGEAAKTYARSADGAFADAVIADLKLATGRLVAADKLFLHCLRRPKVPDELGAYMTMQRADCLVRQGAFKEALAVYETMPARYRACRCTPRAMLRAGVTCVGHLDDDARGARFFKLTEDMWPGSAFAEQALFYRMTLAIWTKRWELAAALRRDFVERYPASEKTPVVTGEYGELISRRIVCLAENRPR